MEGKLTFFLLLSLFSMAKCQRKNILFLMADDMRPDLEVYKDINKDIFPQPKMYTPNLDALAAKSLLFERAYVAQSLCSPSRTAALTGRRTDSTAITQLHQYWREYGGNFTTIPQFFKENGYYAHGAGKVFHGGPSSNKNDCPYSWSKCPYHSHVDYYEELYDGKYSWKAITDEQIAEEPCLDTSNADWFVKQMRDTLKKYDPPYFFGFGVFKPHTPFFFPERFLDLYPAEDIQLPPNPYVPEGMPDKAWSEPPIFRFDDVSAEGLDIPNLGDINVTIPDWKTIELKRAYYAAISHADDELGKVINELYNLGLEDDTIIVFWGDHGWHLGDHAEWCKLTLFETGNRVPFMIHIPGAENNGKQTSKLVETVDLFPTLVEAAGFDPMMRCPGPTSHDIQLCSEGRSLLPLFEDPERSDWDNTVFWSHPRGGYHEENIPWQMGYSIRVDGYRYTEYVATKYSWLPGDHTWLPDWEKPVDHEELYDLKNDPQENFNRYDDPEYLAVKEELAEKLHLGWSARK